MIHSPGGTPAAWAAIRSAMSACERASPRSTRGSASVPKCSRCGWVSMKPGTIVYPPKSMMRESGPALARTVSLAPTMSTFPARIAIASATV